MLTQTSELHEGRLHRLRVDQLEALGRAEFLPDALIDQCRTFREAVWLAWQQRQYPGMTKAHLATVCDLYAPHVTNFINRLAVDEKGRRRADLPAEKISAFEAAVGNRGVSQYLSRVGSLTIMEAVIAKRA